MCLSTVEREGLNMVGTGYKFFIKYGNSFNYLANWANNKNALETERVYTAIDDNSEDYKLGFHIYPNQNALESYVSGPGDKKLKVIFFKGHVIGSELCHIKHRYDKVIVAKYIFILPEHPNIGQRIVFNALSWLLKWQLRRKGL